MKLGKLREHEKNYEEDWNPIGFNLGLVANRLKNYLKVNEFIIADYKIPGIPGNLERSITELREAGLDIGKENQEFGYFIYPQTQPIEKERKLYAYRRF